MKVLWCCNNLEVGDIGVHAVAEALERFAYYGVSSNLVTYLTSVLHQGTVESTTNVFNWDGSTWVTPLLGAFIADAYLGRFATLLWFDAPYLLVSFNHMLFKLKLQNCTYLSVRCNRRCIASCALLLLPITCRSNRSKHVVRNDMKAIKNKSVIL